MPESEPAAPAHGWGVSTALAVVLAGATALAWSVPALGVVVAVIPACAAWFAMGVRSMRRAILLLLATQIPLWLGLNLWMQFVSPPGWIVLALLLATWSVILTWALRRALRAPRFAGVPAVILVPLVVVAIEFARARVVLGGYPWFCLAHPLVEWPVLVQTADLFGTFFVSTLTALPAGAAVDAFGFRRRTSHRRRIVGAGVVAVLWVAALGYGVVRGAPIDGRPGPTFLVIQTNLAQDSKLGWNADAMRDDFVRWVRAGNAALIEAQAGGVTVDAIVWPETMVPGYGLEPQTLDFLVEEGYGFAASDGSYRGDSFALALEEMATDVGVPYLVGSVSHDGFGVTDGRYTFDRRRNSAYLVRGARPHQRVDKMHLTPFGEVMPIISSWPWLESKLMQLGAHGMKFDLDPGIAVSRLDLPITDGTAAIGVPICYEAAVAPVCRAIVWAEGSRAADVLVNLSNDGWFNAYDSGRRQFAQIARFRCIENRTLMVRAANTGLSLMIDSSGRVNGPIGEGRYGTGRQFATALYATTLDDRRPLFAVVGDLWGWGLLLGGLGVIALARRPRETTPNPPASDSGA